MMRNTSSPAILPASLVALRCESLKYAGTVMTACVTFSPSFASASAFILDKIIAEISGGEKVLRWPFTSTCTCASPFAAFTILYGTRCSSSWTSSYLRPMKRLIEKTVFCGFVTACRFAAWPTSRSPLLVKATTEGVVRAPSEFSKTTGSPPSITAMQELVVPKSIPKILAINKFPFGGRKRLRPAGSFSTHQAIEVDVDLNCYKRVLNANRRRSQKRGKRDKSSPFDSVRLFVPCQCVAD